MTRPTYSALDAALDRLASNGQRTPCASWDDGGPWLSEDAGLRTMATRWCAGCPVLAECGTAAAEWRIKFGVWGGRDRTPGRGSPAMTREEDE